MRIAVLSMLETLASGVGAGSPQGMLRVAGRSVVDHQFDLAVALGARRLLVLAPRQTYGVEALVARATAEEMEVRVVSGAPAFCAEVTAADELIVIGDGVLPDPSVALELFVSRSGVAVLPVEPALQAGFERIDAENAWGSLMVVSGSLAEKLRQLPEDCDVPSSLLRIALMAGASLLPVAENVLTTGRWARIGSIHDAQRVEESRIAASLGEAMGHTPGPRIAGLIVQRFGSDILARRSPALLGWAAMGMGALALAVLPFGLSGLTLAQLGAAWLALRGQTILAAAARRGRIASSPTRRKETIVASIYDLIFFLILGVILDGADWHPGSRLESWFIVLVLGCSLRLAAGGFPRKVMRPWFEDRFLLAMILTVASGFGQVDSFSMLIAGATLLAWVVLAVSNRNPHEN